MDYHIEPKEMEFSDSDSPGARRCNELFESCSISNNTAISPGSYSRSGESGSSSSLASTYSPNTPSPGFHPLDDAQEDLENFPSPNTEIHQNINGDHAHSDPEIPAPLDLSTKSTPSTAPPYSESPQNPLQRERSPTEHPHTRQSSPTTNVFSPFVIPSLLHRYNELMFRLHDSLRDASTYNRCSSCFAIRQQRADLFIIFDNYNEAYLLHDRYLTESGRQIERQWHHNKRLEFTARYKHAQDTLQLLLFTLAPHTLDQRM